MMWLVDVSAGLPPAVEVVQFAERQAPSTRAAGFCQLARSGTPKQKIVSARGVARTYLYRYEKVNVDFATNTQVTVVQPPKHGILRVVGASEQYTPSQGFSGSDTFALRVSRGDAAVLLHYHVFVTDGPSTYDQHCNTIENKPADTNPWRISMSPQPVQAAFNSWLRSEDLGRVMAAATAALGGAIGETELVAAYCGVRPAGAGNCCAAW